MAYQAARAARAAQQHQSAAAAAKRSGSIAHETAAAAGAISIAGSHANLAYGNGQRQLARMIVAS